MTAENPKYEFHSNVKSGHYLYHILIDKKAFINWAYKQHKKIMKLKVRTNNIGYDKINNREQFCCVSVWIKISLTAAVLPQLVL